MKLCIVSLGSTLRKPLIVVLIFCVTFACVSDIEAKAIDYSEVDYSITPIVKQKTSQKVFLISYGDGEAHMRNQNYQIQSAINKGFDGMIAFRKEHIDTEFYEQHKKILDQPRLAGYALWKPYIILEALKMISENDILFYIDSGAYLTGSVQPIIDILNKPDTNMVLFENHHTDRCWTKRDTYEIMGVDNKHRDEMQLESGFIMLKKCQLTLDFMQRWLEYCCVERAITDMPSQLQEFDDFVDHRHDQSILTLLYKKYPEKVSVVSRVKEKWVRDLFFLHRRRDASVPIKEVLASERAFLDV